MRTIREDEAGSISYFYLSAIRKEGFFHPLALYVESGLKKAYRLTKQLTRTGRDFFPP